MFCQRVVHGANDFIDITFGTNQRRAQAKRVVKAWQATVGTTDHDALLQTVRHDSRTD